jgi:hypothetical protein
MLKSRILKLGLLGLISSGLPIFAASAHQAKPTAAQPMGWAYPLNCCSNQDCREVTHSAISERPDGYVIGQTGEIIGYADHRLKDSPDGEYHWCTIGGSEKGATICLFVPPSSF